MAGGAQKLHLGSCRIQQCFEGVGGRGLGGGECGGHVAVGAIELAAQGLAALAQCGAGGQIRALRVAARGDDVVFGDDLVAAGGRGTRGLRLGEGLLKLQ